jgi:hypothetical protein
LEHGTFNDFCCAICRGFYQTQCMIALRNIKLVIQSFWRCWYQRGHYNQPCTCCWLSCVWGINECKHECKLCNYRIQSFGMAIYICAKQQQKCHYFDRDIETSAQVYVCGCWIHSRAKDVSKLWNMEKERRPEQINIRYAQVFQKSNWIPKIRWICN